MRSTYWRAGYQVEGAKPVTVEEYGRTIKVAQEAAEKAAKERAEQLAQLGLKNTVTVWTQRHQSWTERSEDERQDQGVFTPRVMDPEAIFRALHDAIVGGKAK